MNVNPGLQPGRAAVRQDLLALLLGLVTSHGPGVAASGARVSLQETRMAQVCQNRLKWVDPDLGYGSR